MQIKKNLCGKRIRQLRKAQDMRQIDLVVMLEQDFGIKMDSTSLGRIERSERGVWDYELVAFAKLLGASVDDLFDKG